MKVFGPGAGPPGSVMCSFTTPQMMVWEHIHSRLRTWSVGMDMHQCSLGD